MAKKIRNLIIFLIIFGLAFLGYTFFIKKDSPNTKSTSTISTTTATTIDGNIAGANNLGQDFLNMLLELRGIKLDAGILTSDAFLRLKENTKILIEEPNPGRPNPFLPLGNDIVDTVENIGLPPEEGGGNGNNNPPVYTTTTLNATSITQTSAVLNGSLAQAITGSIRYFEYGDSATNLNKTTSQITQSGQGNFGVTVSGLTSNKTYYFRSVLSIAGTIFNGEVLSFRTN